MILEIKKLQNGYVISCGKNGGNYAKDIAEVLAYTEEYLRQEEVGE